MRPRREAERQPNESGGSVLLLRSAPPFESNRPVPGGKGAAALQKGRRNPTHQNRKHHRHTQSLPLSVSFLSLAPVRKRVERPPLPPIPRHRRQHPGVLVRVVVDVQHGGWGEARGGGGGGRVGELRVGGPEAAHPLVGGPPRKGGLGQGRSLRRGQSVARAGLRMSWGKGCREKSGKPCRGRRGYGPWACPPRSE